MVRSGRARRKTLPRTSVQSPRQLERLCFSFSLFLYLSLFLPRCLNCSFALWFILRPFWFLHFSSSMPPLYIFPTFLFYSQFLLSSLAFAPFHQRHPLRVVSSSSCPLALSPFSASPYPPLLRFFALFLSHPPLIVSFTFSQPLVEQLEAQLSVTMIPRASGLPSPSAT